MKLEKKHLMKNTDKCEYFISRPDCSAEIYESGKAIIYKYRENGVGFISNEEREKYNEQIKKIEQDLKISIKISRFEYRWTFGSSKPYIFDRNRYLNKIKKKFRYKCQDCKRIFHLREIEVHHILERSKEGTDSPGNLKILCKYCHDIQTRKLMSKKEKPFLLLLWKLCKYKVNLYGEWIRYHPTNIEHIKKDILWVKSDTCKEMMGDNHEEFLAGYEQRLTKLEAEYIRFGRKLRFYKRFLTKLKKKKILKTLKQQEREKKKLEKQQEIMKTTRDNEET
jgi:hypothetical protein